MYEEDDMETKEYYDDAELALYREENSERFAKIIGEYGARIVSRDQMEDKGRLLGHYRSIGFRKSYIDVYERAIFGRAEIGLTRKKKEFGCGYAFLSEAVTEGNVLYLFMEDGEVYRLRHMKNVETIAWQICVRKAGKEE